MKVKGFLAGGVVALALALTSCGGSSSTTTTGGAGPVQLTVGTDAGADLKFAPNNITAPPNTLVKLTLDNKSTQIHNLVFQQGVTVKTADQVAPGSQDTITFTTPGTGTYKFTCSIHPGMEGTLTVK